jgi:DNA polymerase II small subunit
VVGNPVTLSMHGVRTLMYHGTSLDTIIGNISDCSYSAPEKAMIQYLIRRNLVPSYGPDMIAPEGRDYLTIKEIPDIFHCGHVHTNGYANYRGVKVINSGTWQAKTRYQEQLGHQPTPCRVPVINLQNHEVSVHHFLNNG